MEFKEIFDRERGNLTMLILSIIAWIVLQWFDLFYLNYWLGEGFAFIAYLLSFYLIYLGVSIIYEIGAVQNRIKITKSKKPHAESIKGENTVCKSLYGCLEVEIPKGWIITDCYVTIEKITPIYYKNKVPLPEEFSLWLSNATKPEYKMLHWKSPYSYHNATIINIGEDSNRETFSVGKIVSSKIKEINGKIADIITFEFDVAKINQSVLNIMQFGLYEISIKFHWKRNGREMIGKKVDGYIYSRAEGRVKEIRVGVGDYNNDESIPKPL